MDERWSSESNEFQVNMDEEGHSSQTIYRVTWMRVVAESNNI